MKGKTLGRWIFIAAWLFVSVAVQAAQPSLVVAPDRVAYRPGQTAVFTVTASNPSDAELHGSIRLEVIGELDAVTSVSQWDATLVPGDEQAQWVIEWAVPQDALWGHAVEVVFDNNGNEIARAKNFFAVGEPWKVGHWSSLSSMGELPPNEIRRQVMGMAHRWHIGAFDYFSWQPSGWETMAPDEEVWNTGQNVSPESKAALQEMIRQAHDSGVQVYSYLQGASWGLAGLEWIRAHPELWNFDEQGRVFPSRLIFNGELLDRLRTGVRGGKYARAVWAGSGIIWGPPVREYLYDQLRQSVEMFDWDGFRSDGLPYPGNAYDIHGQYHEAVPEDLIDSQVEFIHELRSKLKEIDSECTLHFNAGAVAYYAGRQSLRLFEAKAADSMALWESGAYVGYGRFDVGNFDTYIDYLHQEVAPAREVGGYRQVGYSMFSAKLLEAVTTACGAKWAASQSRGQKNYENGPDPWRTFTFRYSQYFWDPQLRRVEDANQILSVEAPECVRWEDFVHRRIEADGREYLVMHLINLAVPYEPKQKDPDPPIQRDIQIVLRGDDAQRVDRVFALTCDQGSSKMSSELTVTQSTGEARMKLAELDTWTAVVVELNK